MEKRIYPTPIESIVSPEPYARKSFTDAREAVAALKWLYERNTAFLRDSFKSIPEDNAQHRFRAYYPEVSVAIASFAQVDSRLAYGHMPEPGFYSTTITRPDLFESYLVDQLKVIMRNHGVPVTVGESETPIPVHFAFLEGTHVDGSYADAIKRPLRDIFDVPDLNGTDDQIANGTFEPIPGDPLPMAPFTAQRIDYSLHRLAHYTATSPLHFQNFVLFTNYQFYVDEFCLYARDLMEKGGGGYSAFIEPGNLITRAGSTVPEGGVAPERLPQMPAYHLTKPDHGGITMVNIGVGPSNAKTITDHIAVLRPHAWLMLGHCAGLRNSQALGDYVLAHAYVREDHVLGRSATTSRRSASCRSLARSRSTWSRRPSRRTASASACLTGRCCASPTSRCTANSSCPAWRPSSTSARSPST